MQYVRVPGQIAANELCEENYCFSPGRYVRFIPPNKLGNSEFVTLDRLVTIRSQRTKAKKGQEYRYAEIGDINIHTGDVIFRAMKGWELPTNRPAIASHGDVLISTVRTYRMGIGLVIDQGENLVTTNAVLNLCGATSQKPHIDLAYVYSFLRTPFFTEQVWSLLNRGMYPRMDTGALEKIFIPVTKSKRLAEYLSALTVACARKEVAMREKGRRIDKLIQTELETHQKPGTFQFSYPTIAEIIQEGRLDGVIYDQEYKSKIWLVDNYAHGYQTPSNNGFTVTPGPSLEIKILRTRVDSPVPKPGFYALILPMNISEHGTMNVLQYLGTGKKLPLLKKGDIVFGEAGFKKGRSIVLLDDIDRCTTNAHGLYARRADDNIAKSVFFRCIFNWYRSSRLIDIMAVGGSGGHFSPEYFDYIHIPNFHDSVREQVVAQYHADGKKPKKALTVKRFVQWHDDWNTRLGVTELQREMETLRQEMQRIQEAIILGRSTEVPIWEGS